MVAFTVPASRIRTYLAERRTNALITAAIAVPSSGYIVLYHPAATLLAIIAAAFVVRPLVQLAAVRRTLGGGTELRLRTEAETLIVERRRDEQPLSALALPVKALTEARLSSSWVTFLHHPTKGGSSRYAIPLEGTQGAEIGEWLRSCGLSIFVEPDTAVGFGALAGTVLLARLLRGGGLLLMVLGLIGVVFRATGDRGGGSWSYLGGLIGGGAACLALAFVLRQLAGEKEPREPT